MVFEQWGAQRIRERGIIRELWEGENAKTGGGSFPWRERAGGFSFRPFDSCPPRDEAGEAYDIFSAPWPFFGPAIIPKFYCMFQLYPVL